VISLALPSEALAKDGGPAVLWSCNAVVTLGSFAVEPLSH